MTATMVNKQPSCTGSPLVEENHTDLMFEPEEEDTLFLQLKSKAMMQVDGKQSLLAAFAIKDPTMLFDKSNSMISLS
jgi:hypothetical protein